MSQKALARSSHWCCQKLRPRDLNSGYSSRGHPNALAKLRKFPARGSNTRSVFTCSSSFGQEQETQDAPLLKDGQKAPRLAKRAKEKQADREFFIDLLSSAATKRDAKAYITRLKDLSKSGSIAEPENSIPRRERDGETVQPRVNLGGSFGGSARAVDDRPVFSQHEDLDFGQEGEATLHVALVKLAAAESLDDSTIHGIARTLSQLSRLSISPCVVIDTDTSSEQDSQTAKQILLQQADRLVSAIDAIAGAEAVRVDNIFSDDGPGSAPQVQLKQFLMKPLRRGKIPVIVPIAYSAAYQQISRVTGDEALLAVAKELAGLNFKPPLDQDPRTVSDHYARMRKQVSLDRLVILDPSGAMPRGDNPDQKHMFINLEQEFDHIRKELKDKRDVRNLELLRGVLGLLPPTSSALLTTPAEAARSGNAVDQSLQMSSVGTRRQKNPLIHNLLTDKPAQSSSLPQGRLGMMPGMQASAVIATSTFVKRGMPLTILPEPTSAGWASENHGSPRLNLTDSRIDMSRLVHLIDDSFNRKLDVEHYLGRVNDKIAGIVIAGEYEGGALFTWETPEGASGDDVTRLVPYLDKFAVLKKAQGAGGVADILFNAMVRTSFPNGVCWRSRRDNPVNKWYFERSRGTWKIPDTNWTMFWTTEGVVEHDQTFRDYESVCRAVEPSWADKKEVVD